MECCVGCLSRARKRAVPGGCSAFRRECARRFEVPAVSTMGEIPSDLKENRSGQKKTVGFATCPSGLDDPALS